MLKKHRKLPFQGMKNVPFICRPPLTAFFPVVVGLGQNWLSTGFLPQLAGDAVCFFLRQGSRRTDVSLRSVVTAVLLFLAQAFSGVVLFLGECCKSNPLTHRH